KKKKKKPKKRRIKKAPSTLVNDEQRTMKPTPNTTAHTTRKKHIRFPSQATRRGRGQASIEFVLLISFMIIVFAIFSIVLQKRLVQAENAHARNVMEQAASRILNEIQLAQTVHEGYARTFTLPSTIEGTPYNATIVDEQELIIRAGEEEFIVFLPINVTGTICQGENRITQINNKTARIDPLTAREPLPVAYYWRGDYNKLSPLENELENTVGDRLDKYCKDYPLDPSDPGYDSCNAGGMNELVANLEQYGVIILEPDKTLNDADEAIFEDFVKNGGTIFITGKKHPHGVFGTTFSDCNIENYCQQRAIAITDDSLTDMQNNDEYVFLTQGNKLPYAEDDGSGWRGQTFLLAKFKLHPPLPRPDRYAITKWTAATPHSGFVYHYPVFKGDHTSPAGSTPLARDIATAADKLTKGGLSCWDNQAAAP
ncbi:pilus assembly protein, partial [Candidatus Woesearchaeota archaeon]